MTYFVSNYFTKDVLEQRAVKQSEDSLRMVEMNIRQTLDDLMYISNFVQFDPEFNKLLKSYNLIDQQSPGTKQEIALHKLQISNYFEGITNILSSVYITILLEEGLHYTNYPTYDYNPQNFYQEPWFNKLKNLNSYETYWVGSHPTYVNSGQEYSPYLITMARTIKHSNRDQSYAVVSVYESDISQTFKSFVANNKENFYLIDKSGVILSNLNKTEIGDKFPYNLSKDNNYQVIDYQENKYLLVTYPVSYTNWQLASLVPYKETIGNINLVTRTTIIIQGAFLLLFLLALIILVRNSTKPIIRLVTVTKEIEQGNMKVRADIDGNNDVAKLAQSFDDMLDKIEEMIIQIKHKEEAKRMAELEMLQAQINPHFLFNVLNAIRLNLTMNGDKDSSNLILSLSSLLRMTINKNNAFIAFNEEIKIIQHYVKLMNFRHNHNLVLQINIDSRAANDEVPRFFLQPIIENAIIHGFHNKEGKVILAANSDKNYLLIKVKDYGVGISPEMLEKVRSNVFENDTQNSIKNPHSFTGIGIKNVYQRMRIIYGEAFKMEIESDLGKGTSFTFHIPKEE
jgi:two-component system, sensor histidine kinase YesM